MSNSYQGQCSSLLHVYYLSSTAHDHKKKKNHSKNCDISNLCVELVVKEMSQGDVSSRGAAALLRECLASRWRWTVPAIRTLRANVEPEKHKALQHGATLSATLDVFRLLIKIHYNLLQSLVQEAVWQPHIDHIHMTRIHKESMSEKHHFNTYK